MVTAGQSAACCLVDSVDVLLSNNSQETPLGDHKHRRVALHPEQDHKNPLCKNEGNWRNDYPDEDEQWSDSSQDRKFYEDYGFDSDEGYRRHAFDEDLSDDED
ncbi:hypothetical protein ACROYT_G034971 [Oculina patagonica]